MRKKKQILSLDFELDFILLGIVCSYKDYRLCYEINNCMGIDLKREKNLDIVGKQLQESEFSLYAYHLEEDKIIYVVSNKNGISYLVPEQHQVDYFMLFKGAGFNKEYVEEAKKKIKNSKIIMGVYNIDYASLKSKEHLIF